MARAILLLGRGSRGRFQRGVEIVTARLHVQCRRFSVEDGVGDLKFVFAVVAAWMDGLLICIISSAILLKCLWLFQCGSVVGSDRVRYKLYTTYALFDRVFGSGWIVSR